MTRPTPRKSSLAGSSPITSPPAGLAPIDATGWTMEQYEEADQAEQAAQRPKPKRKYPAKVSFYQDPADTDRVRGAILHTMTTEGPLAVAVHPPGRYGRGRAARTQVQRRTAVPVRRSPRTAPGPPDGK